MEVQILSRAQMVVDKEYVLSHKEEVIEAIRKGSIFIYPTDTIYGIGCSALLESSVQKIREIKRRETKPFSVIAPSKDWILENCSVSKEDVDKYLPGPYTLFVNSTWNSKAVNPNDNTLGVRIPDHWFAKVVEEAGVPFVTTSVNFSGENFMAKLEDAPQEILDQADYIVYEGEKRGEPSQKINLVSA